MKKETLRLLILVVFVGLAVWFNLGEDADQPLTESENRSSGEYILAISWQPAFCEKLPNKPECRSQHKNRFDATNFTLHGLWPQPRGNSYCDLPQAIVATDKSGRWSELPKLTLSEELRAELAQKMPGYRSYLHRHEWYKHGSCMPGYSPEDYFQISLNLLDAVNDSTFANGFRRDIGRRLSFRDISSKFVSTFGSPANSKLVVDCYRDDGRRILQEFKLSLRGLINENSDLSELLADGATLGSSCPSGIVDRVGLQ